jgi:hypothetical protein
MGLKTARFLMQRDDGPPGFWPWPEECALVEGVELESAARTRFFQSIDAYPASWGRLSWRIQINKIVADRASVPQFRGFYSGIEWNLDRHDYRWFLTAWSRWEQGTELGEPRCMAPAAIDGDTILFAVPPADPKSQARIYLRSRVDTRNRRQIAEDVRLSREQQATSDPELIVLDDVIDFQGPR